MKKKLISFKNLLLLHFSILLYSGVTVMSKFAAGEDFLSLKYVLYFGLMVLILGVYAILWQQAIKPFEPSVAYSNKSVTTVWVLLLSAVIFKEGITVTNVIGALMIVAGVVLVSLKDD
ncbi:MAG: EamA family transporter [Clostridia bacterium]|nr:EamA family transporter [Clostridia bacterium]